MMDLVEWLRAQLDDDERIANAATSGPWFVHDTYLDRGGYTATVLSGEIGHGELRAWLPTMRSDVPWDDERNVWNDAEHIARHDPARVLREVEAKRLILDEHSAATDHDSKGEWPICATCRAEPPDDDRASWSAYYPCKTLRLLALPYADRPGYFQEWRP